MLVQVRLFTLQLCNRIADSRVLGLLRRMLLLHVVVAGFDFGDEGGANFVRFAGERLLKLHLLLLQLSNLVLVEVELLNQHVHRLLQTVDLALEGGLVDVGLTRHGGLLVLGVDDADV